MKVFRKSALVAAALLLLALGAWKKHGVGGVVGYDFTVDFNTAALGRWTNAAIVATFTNPAVTGYYNDDDSGNPNYVWSVVDASSYPGSHGRALQALLPYGDLGEPITQGCGQTTPDACPSGSFGPTERWAINLADANTVNMSWQMLLVTGWDFRYIGGKAAPNLNYFLNNGTSYPAASLKMWWVADSNTTNCPRNAWPTTGVCPSFWSVKYQGIAGTPTAQQDGFFISTNVWHSFKFQFHRGCPVDQGGCVDHSYINIYGPTSDADDTQILWLTYNPLAAEPNGDTSTNYFPSMIMSSWFGGNQAANSCATVAGCAALYDNIRIWSGTGP